MKSIHAVLASAGLSSSSWRSKMANMDMEMQMEMEVCTVSVVNRRDSRTFSKVAKACSTVELARRIPSLQAVSSPRFVTAPLQAHRRRHKFLIQSGLDEHLCSSRLQCGCLAKPKAQSESEPEALAHAHCLPPDAPLSISHITVSRQSASRRGTCVLPDIAPARGSKS